MCDNFAHLIVLFVDAIEIEKKAGKRLKEIRAYVGNGYEGNLLQFTDQLWDEFISNNFYIKQQPKFILLTYAIFISEMREYIDSRPEIIQEKQVKLDARLAKLAQR